MELDEHVHVAVRSEIITQDRAKQSQPPNSVLVAIRCDSMVGDVCNA